MMTQSPPKLTRISKTVRERLLQRMLEADKPPIELGRELQLSPAQLAAWACDPASVWILQSLSRLADVRAQLLLSNFRANAAVHLIQIASANEPTELSRKACVDLLTADLNAFDRDESQVSSSDRHHASKRPSRSRFAWSPPGVSSGEPSVPSEAAILRALEELGTAEAGESS